MRSLTTLGCTLGSPFGSLLAFGLRAAVLSLVVSIGAAGPVQAEDPPLEPGDPAAEVEAASQPSTPVSRGRARYEALCSACHGDEGAGDGPVAASMRKTLPDLRRIAERHGSFNRATVAATIDGRGLAGAHGSDQKPVWGWKGLRARKGTSGPSPGMLDLLAYLQSIQVQP